MARVLTVATHIKVFSIVGWWCLFLFSWLAPLCNAMPHVHCLNTWVLICDLLISLCLYFRIHWGMILSGLGFLNPSHMLRNINNFSALLYVRQHLQSCVTGLDGWNLASVSLFWRYCCCNFFLLLFFIDALAAQIVRLFINFWNLWTKHTNSVKSALVVQLERAGIGCDPCPSEEIDHAVEEPNMVFYWGLIPEKIMHVDTSSLKEDFMKDVTNDVYGKVKCTRSDVTISVVGLSQLPKSMCTHSVQWQYLQHCMLGYQATSEDHVIW